MLGDDIGKMIRSSAYTVALCGFGMFSECGYPELRDGDEAFVIEQKYGYSYDELFHCSFFNTKKKIFYEFYKEHMLPLVEKKPGSGFFHMAELEKRGYIHSIITKRITGTHDKAGCRNVINLHGTLQEYHCSHCGKRYSVEYVKISSGVPRCERCSGAVRPNVCLFGEMVDNSVMTKAVEEIEKAEVLLVLGTNLSKELCEHLVGYYKGDKLILVTPSSHFSDVYADYVVYDRVDQTLQSLVAQT